MIELPYTPGAQTPRAARAAAAAAPTVAHLV